METNIEGMWWGGVETNIERALTQKNKQLTTYQTIRLVDQSARKRTREEVNWTSLKTQHSFNMSWAHWHISTSRPASKNKVQAYRLDPGGHGVFQAAT